MFVENKAFFKTMGNFVLTFNNTTNILISKIMCYKYVCIVYSVHYFTAKSISVVELLSHVYSESFDYCLSAGVSYTRRENLSSDPLTTVISSRFDNDKGPR